MICLETKKKHMILDFLVSGCDLLGATQSVNHPESTSVAPIGAQELGLRPVSTSAGAGQRTSTFFISLNPRSIFQGTTFVCFFLNIPPLVVDSPRASLSFYHLYDDDAKP